MAKKSLYMTLDEILLDKGMFRHDPTSKKKVKREILFELSDILTGKNFHEGVKSYKKREELAREFIKSNMRRINRSVYSNEIYAGVQQILAAAQDKYAHFSNSFTDLNNALSEKLVHSNDISRVETSSRYKDATAHPERYGKRTATVTDEVIVTPSSDLHSNGEFSDSLTYPLVLVSNGLRDDSLPESQSPEVFSRYKDATAHPEKYGKRTVTVTDDVIATPPSDFEVNGNGSHHVRVDADISVKVGELTPFTLRNAYAPFFNSHLDSNGDISDSLEYPLVLVSNGLRGDSSHQLSQSSEVFSRYKDATINPEKYGKRPSPSTSFAIILDGPVSSKETEVSSVPLDARTSHAPSYKFNDSGQMHDFGSDPLYGGFHSGHSGRVKTRVSAPIPNPNAQPVSGIHRVDDYWGKSAEWRENFEALSRVSGQRDAFYRANTCETLSKVPVNGGLLSRCVRGFYMSLQ